ncbi:hypothetical protein CWR43_21510 [Rhizobium sullae]|uniref:Uncharacterized protein n=1 Tax=Rhizobium sullae TaxID=50338 RepID=A0A2N0D5M8_RHISU|nr:hypothetical protein CWR43_21510 [Rhizobium sullae]
MGAVLRASTAGGFVSPSIDGDVRSSTVMLSSNGESCWRPAGTKASPMTAAIWNASATAVLRQAVLSSFRKVPRFSATIEIWKTRC